MNRTIGGKDNTAFYVESLKATKSARISEDAAVVSRKQNVFEMTTIIGRNEPAKTEQAIK